MTDLAQALHDDPSIAPKIRVYSIGSSNTVSDPVSRDYVFEGLSKSWPNLWWIENGLLPRLSTDTFRSIYLGGDQSGEMKTGEQSRIANSMRVKNRCIGLDRGRTSLRHNGNRFGSQGAM
jgi:hypothetical protein